jgi:hypothetical protein
VLACGEGEVGVIDIEDAGAVGGIEGGGVCVSPAGGFYGAVEEECLEGAGVGGI